MRVAAYKSGGFGDMADYIVLLRSVREKHLDAHITAYARQSSKSVTMPYTQMFSLFPDIIDHAEVLPDEDFPFGDDKFVAEFSRQRYDYFYDFRPYVGRCYRGVESALRLAPDYAPGHIAKWSHQWELFYANPLSQYQNVLQDHFPAQSHLEITTESCELEGPDWGATARLLHSLPDSGFEPKSKKWMTVSVTSAGADKGVRQTKMWSVSNWQAVVDTLKGEGYQIVQLGIGYEPKLKGVTCYWNQPILRLLALLRQSPLHLSVENGTVRMRKLVCGVTSNPSVVLYGPTPASLFQLPGDVAVISGVCRPCFWITGDWMEKCPRAMERPSGLKEIWSNNIAPSGEYDRICMRSITPEMVLEAIYEADTDK